MTHPDLAAKAPETWDIVHRRPGVADRIGHGVRCIEDPAVLDAVAAAGVTLEVCPVSNISLGVYASLEEVPVP